MEGGVAWRGAEVFNRAPSITEQVDRGPMGAGLPMMKQEVYADMR